MIMFNRYGFPVSKDDGMDSCVRNSILTIGGKNKVAMKEYVVKIDSKTTVGLRSPDGYPEANYKNFTRDQHTCLIAGLYAEGRHDLIKNIFTTRARNLFLCQSVERDKRGSTKLPYPHYFYKDSEPVSDTYPFWNKPNGSKYSTLQFKAFDGPDILLPNHIWMMIKGAKLYWLYWFALIGIPFFLLDLLFHSYSNKTEENQMFCQAYVNGSWALSLYKLINTKWELRNMIYWGSRDEFEYHDIMEGVLNEKR